MIAWPRKWILRGMPLTKLKVTDVRDKVAAGPTRSASQRAFPIVLLDSIEQLSSKATFLNCER